MSEGIKLITSNRKARHDYHIEDTLEAGIVLQGTEVKSLREGRANLQDAFCAAQDGEMYLYNCHISPYGNAGHFNHDPTRPRKLLMRRRDIERWDKAAQQKQYTIVPLKLYFRNGWAKVEIALGKGKKLYDKRQTIAERESERRLDRIMKQYK